jgi:hypothetical protein
MISFMKPVIREPIMVLLFGFLSCGIYIYYWLYKVSEETQTELGIMGQETSPTMELVFSIVSCGIYFIYWIYKYSKLIYDAQTVNNLPAEDNSMLNLILSIFGLGIVSVFLMQSSLNKVWESK